MYPFWGFGHIVTRQNCGVIFLTPPPHQHLAAGGGGQSVVSDSATPWTIAPQAPLSMEFSWQEYWSGEPFPSPGDLPDTGIEPASPMSPALAGG